MNREIHDHGLQAAASTAFGQKFCADWASKDDEGHQAILPFTQSILQNVYERHRDEIKAARAKYIAEHPGYKD